MLDNTDADRLAAAVTARLHLTDENFAVFLVAVAVGVPLDLGMKTLDPHGTVLTVACSLAKALVFTLCSCDEKGQYEPGRHAAGCGYGRLGEVVRAEGERMV